MTAVLENNASATTLTEPFIAAAALGNWVAALKAAGAGVAARPPVPVLTGVKIQALAGAVSIVGTDYATFAQAEVVGASGTGSPIVVGYKMLLDMLTTAGKRAAKRVSDSWNVTLTEGERHLTVAINGSTFTLSKFDAEMFPAVPERNATHTLRVDPALFIRRMDSALVAVSTDDTLPILTAVRIEVANGVMQFLATDRYRLVLAEMPVASFDDNYSLLLSAKVWKAIKRNLAPKGAELVLRIIEDGWIGFRQGGTEFNTLGVDGDYPRVRSLFPDTVPIVFELDADLLASMVASVAVTAERNTPIRFSYDGFDSLCVDAGTGEDTQAEAAILYSSPRGNEAFTAAFNPKYLLDALKDFKGQTIQFQHTTAPKPAVIVGTGTDAVRHLIMPVRLPA